MPDSATTTDDKNSAALMDLGALPIGTTMSKRAWRIYLAGGLAAVALYFLLPLKELWSNLAYDLIGLSSVAAIQSECAATGQPGR